MKTRFGSVFRGMVLAGLLTASAHMGWSQENSFLIGGKHFMVMDVKSLQPAATDTVMFRSKVFLKREAVQKFIPKGWRVPDYNDIMKLISALEGEATNTGGKNVDSTYLQQHLPFRLDGIYYTAVKRIIGWKQMTAYYTARDTVRQFGTEQKQAQVALHVYRSSNGRINIEPTYSDLQRSAIFCEVLLLKE